MKFGDVKMKKVCPKCGSKDIQYKTGWWEVANPPLVNFCYKCGYFFSKVEVTS